MKIRSINPFTEEINKEFDPLSAAQADEAVQKAREAFGAWKRLGVADRVKPLARLAANLQQRKVEYGRIITKEMGKPVKQAIGEVEKCAWLCEYYAESAPKLLKDEIIRTEASRSYVRFEPLGVILGVMPWNFPFWQVFRFAVPVMAVGNVCLLKHASNVPITALEIERLFADSGFPPHIFQTLLIDSAMTRQLIEEDKVDGVSLTGSVAAGSQVGASAGKGIKKLVLELGGSDPFIVLDDADVAKAAEVGVLARTFNTGQSCIAAKRFIVMESVAAEFQERFIDIFSKLKVGDPMQDDTDVGPLARKEFVDDLQRQVDDAEEKGATITYGSSPPEGKGFFFRPAVVTGVKPDMKVLTEEVFGPVAPIIVVREEEEIVRIANSTEFGLGAAVWSRSMERAEQLSRKIDSGFIAINDFVKSDPRLPFGGVKKSGIGRELSYFGLKEFVNAKTVVVK